MATKGIYKRGNVWWIRFKGADEEIKSESSGSHRKRDAEDLLTKRKNEVQDGRYTIAKCIRRCTFNELADRYDNFVKNSDLTQARNI